MAEKVKTRSASDLKLVVNEIFVSTDFKEKFCNFLCDEIKKTLQKKDDQQLAAAKITIDQLREENAILKAEINSMKRNNEEKVILTQVADKEKTADTPPKKLTVKKQKITTRKDEKPEQQKLQDPKNTQDLVAQTTTRKNRSMIVGSSTNNIGTSSTTALQGVPKCVHLHVYRMDPTTTCEALQEYLRPHFPEVTCMKLESRNAAIYSSFKVSIYKDNFDEAMNPSVWPKNACVRKFFYLKTREQTPV